MDLLHLVLTFNLVTAVMTLAGCYYLHRTYDDRTDSEAFSATHVAGLSGVAVSVGLLSTLGVMFI
jgi:hypothetical protein